MRFLAIVWSTVRSLIRDPFLLAIAIVGPPLFVFVFAEVLTAMPDVLLGDVAQQAFGRMTGALFATSFLAGILGLFQVISAMAADRRLRIAGFSDTVILAGRLTVILLISAAVAALALGVLLTGVDVASIPLAYVALLAGATVYGVIGVAIGSLVSRELEGSLLLAFMADLDTFLSTGILEADAWFTNYFPLNTPHTMLEDAVFEGTLQTGDVLVTVTYVAVCLVVAAAFFRRASSDMEGVL